MVDFLNTGSAELKLTPAATLIPIRDGENGIEVLMLKRQKRSSFLPNVWVFPGGALDAEDQQATIWQSTAAAAIRETQEEAGLYFEPQALIPFSRWIAPKEAVKRFDTYFFLAKTEQYKTTLQLAEVTDSQWINPRLALEQHHSNNFSIIPPTMVSLSWLSHFDSADKAIRFFADKTAFTFAPKVCFQGSDTLMLYPGDIAFDSEDLSLKGRQHRCLLKEQAWHYIWDKGVWD